MSHKNAPPETPEQQRMTAFYTARGVVCGWGRSESGAYLAPFARDAWAAWQEAQKPAQPADDSDLVIGQCRDCGAINRHEPNCKRNEAATPVLDFDVAKLRDLRERFIFQGGSLYALALADRLERLEEEQQHVETLRGEIVHKNERLMAFAGIALRLEAAITAIKLARPHVYIPDDCDKTDEIKAALLACIADSASAEPQPPWLCRCGVHNHWQRTACGMCDRPRP